MKLGEAFVTIKLDPSVPYGAVPGPGAWQIGPRRAPTFDGKGPEHGLFCPTCLDEELRPSGLPLGRPPLSCPRCSALVRYAEAVEARVDDPLSAGRVENRLPSFSLAGSSFAESFTRMADSFVQMAEALKIFEPSPVVDWPESPSRAERRAAASPRRGGTGVVPRPRKRVP